MAGAGRRLVLEGAFLVGLAVAAGLAEFTTEEIIEVMALGWLVTVLIELVAWRLSLRKPVAEETPAPPVPVPASAPMAAAAPVPEPAPDAEPEVVPDAESELDPYEAAARAEEEAGGLRPAEPKRGGIFGWRRKAEPVGEFTDETPPPPRHVRLIERSNDNDEPAGDHDESPAERAKGA